jgi:peptide/nickel transport system substrate-binding protein
LLANLSTVVLGIVSPAAVKKLGQDFGNNPVGTGPYTMTEWVRGDHATVTRWDKYVNTSELTQHKGPPYLDSMVIRFIPEDQTRLATLKNGEVDYMFNIPALDVGGLKSDSKYQTFENMFTGDPTMFLINRQLTPTDDLAVAQALEFAVNKEVISKIATSNTSPVAWGPLKPTNWGYNPEIEKLYRFDPEQAKQGLDKAGWTPGAGGLRTKDGKDGKLVINVKDDKLTVSMLTAIQGMLQAVGLDLEIRTMALAASEDLARQGKNNLTFMDWRGTDPDILTVHFHSSNIGGWNMGYFKNDEVDKLLDSARTTVDPQKRLPMYQQAQTLIMQQAATLPLFNQVAVDGAKATLQGVRFDATKYYPEWYDASWKA